MRKKRAYIVLIFMIAIQLLASGCGAKPSDADKPSATYFFEKISCVLPDGMTAGEFDEFLGMGGGVPLYNDEGTECGCIEINKYAQGIFEEGELVGVEPFHNHSWFASEFQAVISAEPCVMVEYSKDTFDDETGLYAGQDYFWYAFWAKEGSEPMYAVYLSADCYDQNDLLTLAESATFSEDAFQTEQQTS